MLLWTLMYKSFCGRILYFRFCWIYLGVKLLGHVVVTLCWNLWGIATLFSKVPPLLSSSFCWWGNWDEEEVKWFDHTYQLLNGGCRRQIGWVLLMKGNPLLPFNAVYPFFKTLSAFYVPVTNLGTGIISESKIGKSLLSWRHSLMEKADRKQIITILTSIKVVCKRV